MLYIVYVIKPYHTLMVHNFNYCIIFGKLLALHKSSSMKLTGFWIDLLLLEFNFILRHTFTFPNSILYLVSIYVRCYFFVCYSSCSRSSQASTDIIRLNIRQAYSLFFCKIFIFVSLCTFTISSYY